jgi:aminopeptidase N
MKMLVTLPVMFLAALPALADDYPRQPGIDAQHYLFRIALTDDSEEITGEATVSLRFVQPGVTRVWLDLAAPKGGKGMTVSSVSSQGVTLPFTHEGERLNLSLPEAPASGEVRNFTIRYRGIAAAGLHFGRNRYGDRTVFSWNWPTFAREWLPVIDHPSDKATSEFEVTAPSHYQVVANGALIEIRDLDNRRRMTHWRESVPIASWLNNIGVAEFAMRSFDTVRGVPLETWVFPRDRDNGIVTFESPMRQALEFFSEFIGPYPYEKLASVQVNGMGGGMEHASAVFYGEKEVRAVPAFSLVAHEVSHQWWGDSVTESDWDDAWLSEGFATYFAALAQEHYLGHDAFLETMSHSRLAILQMEKKAAIPVVHNNLADIRTGRAPIGLVYQKGGWFLHMLRSQVGDEAFRDGIREYYRRFRDRNASTGDLQRVMEEKSGQDLKTFFAQWLRRGASPTLDGTWSYDAGGGKVIVEIEQTQSGEPFRLSLPIGITRTGGNVAIAKLMLDSKNTRQEFPCAQEPVAVTLDPEVRTLMESHFRKKQ